MDLDKAIHSRKSAKKFGNKKPNWRDIIECIDAARYAPMAGGNFSLKFILVTDKEKIAKVAKFAEQDHISMAHYLVIVYSVVSRTENSFGERGKIYLRQQAGAAIQNFLLKIEEKDLDSCWVGHFNEGKIKKEFSIPESSNVEAILPVGYESKAEKTSKKIDLDRILYFEKHGKKKMNKIKRFDV